MATVDGLTKARMLAIEAASVVDGDVVGDNLILTKHDGSTIDAGNVRGPAATLADISIRGDAASWAWTANWGEFDTGDNAIYYQRLGRINTLGGAIRYTGGAAASLATTTTIATLTHTDYRDPTSIVNVSAGTNTGILIRVMIGSGGRIRIQKLPSGAFSYPSNDYFTFATTWISATG